MKLSSFLVLSLFNKSVGALQCSEKDRQHPLHSDLVEHLPGLDQPTSSLWFSGYLEYDLPGTEHHIHTHYVLVTAEEDYEHDKPLIYWSNGGPGASSLFGLLTELGPYQFDDRSLQTEQYKTTGIPTPIYNPYNWAKLGNLLVFDQPAPVGFSYCDHDTSNSTCQDIAWTDELASLSTYTALQTFYDQYACFASSKELFLTGESYAGIYIPTLARRVYLDMESNNMNLKGFAVGDGCLGTQTGICSDLGGSGVDLWPVLFMAGHGQIPLATFREVIQACHNVMGGFTSSLRPSAACDKILAEAKKQVGGFFEYGLYDECTYEDGLLTGGVNDYACGAGPVMEKWVHLKEVQYALHTRSDFFSVDNAEGGFDYTPTEPDLQPFYQSVNGKLKVIVYNGDTDPAITSFAAQNWTSHLGFAETQKWRPWTIDSCQRMGGYVVRYAGGFDFLTIRGAGHMVPNNKPVAAFTFIQAWLNGDDYPIYNEDCQGPSSSKIKDGERLRGFESEATA